MIAEFPSAPMPEETQKEQLEELEHDFPKSIGRPATRALLVARYARLEGLTGVREVDIEQLHGAVPKATKIPRATLAEKGLSFADKQ